MLQNEYGFSKVVLVNEYGFSEFSEFWKPHEIKISVLMRILGSTIAM